MRPVSFPANAHVRSGRPRPSTRGFRTSVRRARSVIKAPRRQLRPQTPVLARVQTPALQPRRATAITRSSCHLSQLSLHPYPVARDSGSAHHLPDSPTTTTTTTRNTSADYRSHSSSSSTRATLNIDTMTPLSIASVLRLAPVRLRHKQRSYARCTM